MTSKLKKIHAWLKLSLRLNRSCPPPLRCRPEPRRRSGGGSNLIASPRVVAPFTRFVFDDHHNIYVDSDIISWYMYFSTVIQWLIFEVMSLWFFECFDQLILRPQVRTMNAEEKWCTRPLPMPPPPPVTTIHFIMYLLTNFWGLVRLCNRPLFTFPRDFKFPALV